MAVLALLGLTAALAMMVQIIGAELPAQVGPESGKLNLVSKSSQSLASNDICLGIQPPSGGQGIDFTSVADISPAKPLDLGVMPGAGSPNHGVGFSFGATYDSEHIIATSGWSQCTLTYRFTLAPPSPTGQ